jgi:hypothetical protein
MKTEPLLASSYISIFLFIPQPTDYSSGSFQFDYKPKPLVSDGY